jgi:hypothetical protein
MRRLAWFGIARGAAVLLAAGGASPVHAAGGATGGRRAGAAERTVARNDQPSGPTSGLILAVSAPELASSARRDFELNLTRGLRFSGLEVAAESAGGAAPALAACADAGCVRAIGAARGAMALVRASIRAAPEDERNGARRSYTIEIEALPTSTGRPSIQRRNVCASCTIDVATHLAYLLAAEVGQNVGQKAGEASSSTAATATETPPPPPPARSEAPVKPATVARTPPAAIDATPSAPARPPAAVALDSSAGPTVVPHHVAAAVLGGLGVAAVTSGAVLWLRGPQSTCPGLPPSACGQTYDDTTTGQVLVGAGAAALAGAVLWWSWPVAEENPKAASPRRVAITSRGVLVGGSF